MFLKNKYPILFSIIFLILFITISGLVLYYFYFYHGDTNTHPNFVPMVINTWSFEGAAVTAWEYLTVQNKSAVDAVEAGCMYCEIHQCKRTVGFGGSPDENGETTLDALIIDGSNMNMGAIGGLRSIKYAISVARKVLENTKHTLIAGDLASEFAADMGFVPESLSTNESREMFESWKNNSCQPNFWQNVEPDPSKSCGPYTPMNSEYAMRKTNNIAKRSDQEPTNYNHDHEKQVYDSNHDTITMLAIDKNGNVAAGGSTNGLIHKIAGRVGDTPVPGAGAYADNAVGAASATGNGDIMMRFVPSFLAVEEMRRGASPKEAAETAIKRIRSHFPDFSGAIITANIYGEYGAACNGMESFPFCVANPSLKKVKLYSVKCFKN